MLLIALMRNKPGGHVADDDGHVADDAGRVADGAQQGSKAGGHVAYDAGHVADDAQLGRCPWLPCAQCPLLSMRMQTLQS
eukprot:169264-Pelagomonas_calceolata.AAC.1